MELSPESTGGMAQILAILLIASAFAPEFRGTLANRTVRDENGEYHRVPSRRRQRTGGAGKLRLYSGMATLAAITVDALLILGWRTLTDVPGLVVMLFNALALGGVVGNIAVSVLHHHHVFADEEGADAK